jgi:glycosyltransferase involved in cell wall biosynthesis
MSTLRILTDMEIRQSPRWCARTDYLGELQSTSLTIGPLPPALRRLLSPFVELVSVIKHAYKYDVVINANIKTAQLFGLYRSLFRIRRPKHMILELMLDEDKKTLLWKMKKLIQRLAFASANLICVSSTHEVAYYAKRFRLSEDRFRFLPFHTNVIEPRALDCAQNYILSAGKTGRDYATLAQAVRDLDRDTIVISDRENARDVVFPQNAKVFYDISYSDYLHFLYNCLFVVVPLKKLIKSSGQVVILEAMALGKPVIATRTGGTIDYIESGVNGILVPVGDPRALRDAIANLLAQPDLRRELAANALESVKKNYTFDKYTRRILEAANALAQAGK